MKQWAVVIIPSWPLLVLWYSVGINDKWCKKKKECFLITISLNSCCKPQKFVPRWASAFANWLPRGRPDLPSLLHKLTTAAALIKSWTEVPECSFPLTKVKLQSGIDIIRREQRQGVSGRTILMLPVRHLSVATFVFVEPEVTQGRALHYQLNATGFS